MTALIICEYVYRASWGDLVAGLVFGLGVALGLAIGAAARWLA